MNYENKAKDAAWEHSETMPLYPRAHYDFNDNLTKIFRNSAPLNFRLVHIEHKLKMGRMFRETVVLPTY